MSDLTHPNHPRQSPATPPPIDKDDGAHLTLFNNPSRVNDRLEFGIFDRAKTAAQNFVEMISDLFRK